MQIHLINFYYCLHFNLRNHIKFHKLGGLTILPLKKIRHRISFNRSYLLWKSWGTSIPNSISLRKHRKNLLVRKFPPKLEPFFLLSNTYAKISWHPLANSLLAVRAEIKQGETTLRSPWYLIIGLLDILNFTILLKHSKTA